MGRWVWRWSNVERCARALLGDVGAKKLQGRMRRYGRLELPINQMARMQGIDLFAGAGGMSIGAINCGVEIRYAVEMDAKASKTFKSNHPETTLIERDIRTVSHLDLRLDKKIPCVLFGGPPCQGFSTSNQKTRSIDNEKNWLFREYLRVANEIRPDWIVFENVKGLLETENGFFLEAVLRGFQDAGYTTSHFVLNSADFGVPQKRNRLFIIASLHGIEVSPPSPTVKKAVTVGQAILDLPGLDNGDSVCELPYGRAARTKYARSMRKELRTCSNNIVTNNAAHIIKRYAHIPQGGNWEDIPKRLMKNYTDVERCHTGIYRRLRVDEPAVVIGNYRKNMLIHPTQDRGLSVREAARLQSFPDDFKFYGSIGFQQQQVGNAVPPLLAEAVFSQIQRCAK
jgi:DNA (cytosine-5)-methyltransferase 1